VLLQSGGNKGIRGSVAARKTGAQHAQGLVVELMDDDEFATMLDDGRISLSVDSAGYVDPCW
jgi:hypothetical protein